MAKRRKTAAKRKHSNPASPKFPTDRLVPVRAVKVNKRGVVTQVVMENKHMGKLKRGK